MLQIFHEKKEAAGSGIFVSSQFLTQIAKEGRR
jgi:hypothetical protein